MNRKLRLRRMVVLFVVCTLVLAVGVNTAQAGICVETVNPAGNPAVGDNGLNPGDLGYGFFGDDAVPGGKSTTPGNQGNGPINSDGFYLVGGPLWSGEDGVYTPILYPGTTSNVWPATPIKYTEWGSPNIRITSTIGGPTSAILYHIQAPGDLYEGGGAVKLFCGVPPPPF